MGLLMEGWRNSFKRVVVKNNKFPHLKNYVGGGVDSYSNKPGTSDDNDV